MPLLAGCRAYLSPGRRVLQTTPAIPFRSTPTRLQSTSGLARPALRNNRITYASPATPPRFVPLKVTVPAIALATGVFLYNVSDPFRHGILALHRMMVAGEAVVIVGIDYKFTMDFTNRDLKQGDPQDEKERAHRMSALHKRSAERLREMLRKNGGIYIKLVSAIFDGGTLSLGSSNPLRSLLTRFFRNRDNILPA